MAKYNVLIGGLYLGKEEAVKNEHELCVNISFSDKKEGAKVYEELQKAELELSIFGTGKIIDLEK